MSIAPLPAATPGDRPVALLMRHAERPAIRPGEVGNELALTARGWQQAEAMGQLLGARLHRLHTSPVRRCRETAEALRRGARSKTPIVDDRMLGDPGVFVVDPERALEHWHTLGHERVMRHMATGTTGLSGLADPMDAARRLAAHLTGLLEGVAPGVHVFVTHDAILLPAVARLLADVDATACPAFLECATFWREGQVLLLAYRDCVGQVSR